MVHPWHYLAFALGTLVVVGLLAFDSVAAVLALGDFGDLADLEFFACIGNLAFLGDLAALDLLAAALTAFDLAGDLNDLGDLDLAKDFEADALRPVAASAFGLWDLVTLVGRGLVEGLSALPLCVLAALSIFFFCSFLVVRALLSRKRPTIPSLSDDLGRIISPEVSPLRMAVCHRDLETPSLVSG